MQCPVWKDRLNYKVRPIEYNTIGLPNLAVWRGRHGNRERIDNLKWARDHCDGLFRVVITVANDVNARTREIAEAYPQPRMMMRLIELNEGTGEFRAVNVAD